MTAESQVKDLLNFIDKVEKFADEKWKIEQQKTSEQEKIQKMQHERLTKIKDEINLILKED